MKNGLLILLLVCIWGCSQHKSKQETASDPQIDSIQALLGIAKTATELSFEDRQSYIKEAEAKTLTLENDTVQLEELSKVSLAYMKLKDSLGFRKSNAKLLEMAKEAKATKILGYSHWDLGTFLEGKGVVDSAFYHYKKAIDNFQELSVDSTSQSLRGRMLYNMARIQDSYKDYLGGEINAAASIQLFDALDDDYRLYNAYNVLGILATGMGNTEKAIESYEKAKEYLDNSDRTSK